MKSPQSVAIALLALTTLGGAMLAWHQYQELIELRATALSQSERADLQKRIWDLEKRNKDLAASRGAASSPLGAAIAGDGSPADDRGPGGFGGPGRGGRGNPMQQLNALRGLMSKPEVLALLSVQQKAAVDARYAALFRTLNLTSDQRAKVESIMADFQTTRLDTMTAARDQGIRDPAEMASLMSGIQNDYNSSLKSVLGDSGFAQYQNYEATIPQRNVVTQLQGLLANTDSPLTSTQAENLVTILAANPAPVAANNSPANAGDFGPPPGGGGPGGGFGGPGGIDVGAVVGAVVGGGVGAPGGRGPNGTATITTAAINQSQTVLTQSQVTALQQIQQGQLAQQQLQQIVRETLSANPTSGGTTPTPGSRRGGG